MATVETPGQSGRTGFIDRLRVVLAALVIAHHAAITYGGAGSWFYREVTDAGRPGSLLLTLFCAVNQSFFMGMFFLLAGYFTPGSLQRKGLRRFLLDRGVRLGVPLLVFGFVLGPMAVALGCIPKGQSVFTPWGDWLGSGAFVLGPLWFAWALLLFTLAWILWSRASPRTAWPRSGTQASMPSGPNWLLSAVLVGLAALGIRQWIPVGQNVLGLQLGYFASYVFLFFLGCRASAGRWLERVSLERARDWGLASLVAIPLLPLGAVLSGAMDGKAVDFNGGLSAAAVLYALWEPFVAWGIMAVLLVQFRLRFNVPSQRWKRWGEEAYGAFFIHAPVVVALSVLIAPWPLPSLLKFLLVSVFGTALSFLLARTLRALPGVTRVL
ncbi:acyltransferase family protein [Hydrogenophaga sp. BPS33]|uniref:acyltransferase family protein n=1 Tax=Hydrogenophaga sp. BPS33 TaxID=2651974 RepID=UPI0013200980|nr:acyltransferase family protein [Hydrogenophaga sp. BPS33]QHE85322.1 acyltransferase family protein [Hydrogenophaga sp. BPS33]